MAIEGQRKAEAMVESMLWRGMANFMARDPLGAQPAENRGLRTNYLTPDQRKTRRAKNKAAGKARKRK